MRFMIDTHVFLWFIAGDTRLSQPVRAAIEAEENEVLMSIASVWEIAIKIRIGKLALSQPFADLIPAQIAENEIELMPVSMDELKVVAMLPLHHRDPFDRLLIAQAMVQRITLVSDDPSFAQYGVPLFW